MLSEVTETDLGVTPAREVSPETDFCCFDKEALETPAVAMAVSLGYKPQLILPMVTILKRAD